jgi:hypothetical protein
VRGIGRPGRGRHGRGGHFGAAAASVGSHYRGAHVTIARSRLALITTALCRHIDHSSLSTSLSTRKSNGPMAAKKRTHPRLPTRV